MKFLAKPLVFLSCSAPFVYMLWSLFSGKLGPNPIDSLTDQTGTVAIRILLISLAVTPLRYLLKKTWPLRFRRMLGLFAFFYALVHVSIYAVLDQQLSLELIVDDLAERPYILAGTLSFLLLVPLAVTSTRKMVVRLGRRWSLLHRAVYLAAAAAVVHYVWLARGDVLEPFIYLWVLMLLFSIRLIKSL
jgi:sulfoxide reductase heme-binding subunit YedZ